MNLYDIPVLGMIRVKMNWLSDRQTVLAQNVANSSTSGYKAQDLKKMSFDEMVQRADHFSTHTSHRPSHAPNRVQVGGMNSEYSIVESRDGEMTPNGNSVILEEQMMKMAENQAQFQSAIGIYQRGLSILRTAVRSQ